MDKPAIGQRTGFRFSLKLLLLSVVPVSLTAAALESATAAWAAAATTSTLLALFGTVVAAAFDVRRRRPIWFGFAVCAGGYLLALFIAPIGLSEGFATEQLNRMLLESLHPGVGYPVDVPFFCPSLNEPADDDRRLAAAYRLLPSPRPFVPLLNGEMRRAELSLFTMVDASADSGSPANPTNVPAATTSAVAPTNTGAFMVTQSAENLLTATNFKVIARCAWAWLIGACGACLAFCLASWNTLAREDHDPVSAGAVIKSTRSLHRQAVAISGAVAAVTAIYGGFALWNPGNVWACAAMSGAAIVPLGLAICAVFGSPQRRPYCAGFAICCGGYFLLSSFAGPFEVRDTGLDHFLNATATTQSISSFYERRSRAMLPHLRDSSIVPDGNDATEIQDIAVNFHTAAHGLVALFLGSLGGGLAQFLVRRRSRIKSADRATPEHAATGAFDAID